MITVIEPGWEWTDLASSTIPNAARHIERCGRVCYKSEDRITDASADKFVKKICKNNHESVLEHVSLTAIIRCSRACSHQLVRHRIAAYSQESMRYCNYGKKGGLQVICPPSIGIPAGDYSRWHFYEGLSKKQNRWISAIGYAFSEYEFELAEGVRPEDARFVLPNATKTELAVTFNLRMWKHVIEERALNSHAQWEIRAIFGSIYEDLKLSIPSVFGETT